MFDSMLNYVIEWFHPVYKYIIHLFTGKSEIERICCDLNNGRHTEAMSIQFAKSVRKSKQLKEERTILFTYQSFSVNELQQKILRKKKMEKCKSLVVANVRNNLRSLRLLSVVVNRLAGLRKEQFSYDNIEHTKMLDELWNNLRPNVRRSTKEWTCPDWGEIGFQGLDPKSDFRGMGMLGLIQLVYLSRHSSAEAIKLVQISNYDHLFFPFAATGINFTAFVIEMLENTHFHSYILLNHMDRILLEDTIDSVEGCSEDEKCIAFTLNVIHDLYSEIFLTFGKMWVDAKPKNIMEFPKVFEALKKQMKIKYPPL